ncbi:MAG: DUF2927 domain-containing protein [Limimaricola sp.]|uniref:DUF2927 domain-containing protein n=1 Tax=Limimaricola sp. TaxID=2211665 RepID=UPI001D738792|nr:DUF2927 domain-containing protein [Limimaricola sp.]MBI1416299.1 DUF2927 domain-containing protein [Limimaricola sp.]
MGRGNWATALRLIIAAGGLSACAMPLPVSGPPVTSAPPAERPVSAAPATPAPSAESQALARYYARVQKDLIQQGLLRGDGGGPDAPFTDTDLTRNFIRIALFNEYSGEGDLNHPRATETRLRRWDRPIRMSTIFGASVPEDQRSRDRASVAAYAAKLSRLTGVPITRTDTAPNYFVLFLNEDERQAGAPLFRSLLPGIDEGSVQTLVTLPRDQFCVVIAFARGDSYSYADAIAVIRAEHPDAMRIACIQEELAQGMGLANDSPEARPSIFNDDQEFALLTKQDALMLRMLYDPRLKTGMTAAEAAPIARVIAHELMATQGQGV